jgi:hypothetical protein
MKLQQLFTYRENRPGRLWPPLDAIAAEGIEILPLSLAGKDQSGILRLILGEWVRARHILNHHRLPVRERGRSLW